MPSVPEGCRVFAVSAMRANGRLIRWARPLRWAIAATTSAMMASRLTSATPSIEGGKARGPWRPEPGSPASTLRDSLDPQGGHRYFFATHQPGGAGSVSLERLHFTGTRYRSSAEKPKQSWRARVRRSQAGSRAVRAWRIHRSHRATSETSRPGGCRYRRRDGLGRCEGAAQNQVESRNARL
jgi:hypothetical protein